MISLTSSHVCKILQSAFKQPGAVDGLLVKKGFIIGPFSKSSFSAFRVSPQKITRGWGLSNYRGVLSLKWHSSLIPPLFSVLMAENTTRMIKSTGGGAWLWKADI